VAVDGGAERVHQVLQLLALQLLGELGNEGQVLRGAGRCRRAGAG
jgi:hypothetical protein